MRVGELGPNGIAERLAGSGLAVRTGPLSFRLRCRIDRVVQAVQLLYADYPLLSESDFCDFELELRRVPGLRGWVRPQVQALYDGNPSFEPLPLGHAFPLFEWTLNWCVTSHSFEHLTLHAAVIERGGRAAILPAPPGSGKSTLCAALSHRGWRLLSDELALVSLADGALSPLARPVSLKNRSLQVLPAFAPETVLSAPTHDTTKGTVAHMRVPREHIDRMDETARPAWVIYPRYEPGSPPLLTPRPKADAMLELGRNAFNYGVLGRAGFDALAGLVDACAFHDFRYSRLDDAIALFDRLAADEWPA
jgi:HprK-related kinase A